MTVRVVRNDWSTIDVPRVGRWRPELSVSVVIPAYQCQASLDLTLAALAHQTYPSSLLEVVVVDDGSQPPLELPKLRPERCRLVRPATGWGRANALHAGAEQCDGEVIHWLDADMVVYPDHVEAQARWHHQLPYAVTLGSKRFVDVTPDGPGWPSADQVAQACAEGDADRLFAGLPSEPHAYVDRMIDGSRQLRAGDHLSFLAHVGATAALRRELYLATGGLDTRLRLGEDTELGYRLAQAGAVFVPEPQARSWHLGRTHMMRHEQLLQRYNRPFLADRMPHPRWLRRRGGTAWAVPLVVAVIDVDGQPLERVRAAVDSVLRAAERDLRVVLVGSWQSVTEQRMSPLTDPQLDLRLIAASYRSDPRVQLAEEAPATAFPSPYLLRTPATSALAPAAVGRLVEYADKEQLGLVRAGPVELWRTAAVQRAGWVRREGEPLAAAVGTVHGIGELSPELAGIADLAAVPLDQLDDVVVSPAGQWRPAAVEVAGVRSLVRAAALVARLAAARLRLPRRQPRVR